MEIPRAPAWGADRIRYQLAKEEVVPVPGPDSVYRALLRHGLVEPGIRRRKRSDYRRTAEAACVVCLPWRR
jgi:hypothetical protein